jgi:hypothetical protein
MLPRLAGVAAALAGPPESALAVVVVVPCSGGPLPGAGPGLHEPRRRASDCGLKVEVDEEESVFKKSGEAVRRGGGSSGVQVTTTGQRATGQQRRARSIRRTLARAGASNAEFGRAALSIAKGLGGGGARVGVPELAAMLGAVLRCPAATATRVAVALLRGATQGCLAQTSRGQVSCGWWTAVPCASAPAAAPQSESTPLLGAVTAGGLVDGADLSLAPAQFAAAAVEWREWLSLALRVTQALQRSAAPCDDLEDAPRDLVAAEAVRAGVFPGAREHRVREVLARGGGGTGDPVQCLMYGSFPACVGAALAVYGDDDEGRIDARRLACARGLLGAAAAPMAVASAAAAALLSCCASFDGVSAEVGEVAAALGRVHAARRRLLRAARATGGVRDGGRHGAARGVTTAAAACAVDAAAAATVAATMAMEMVRYATWVWPAVLTGAVVSRFGISLSDVSFALALPSLFVVAALSGVGAVIDAPHGGAPRVLRAVGALAAVEAALVFASWTTGAWWPVLLGRALLGLAEAAEPAAGTIIARRVPHAWFGFITALCVTAGTSGPAAVAAALPSLPPAAFPWLHLGMGATTAALAWAAAALEEVRREDMRVCVRPCVRVCVP